MTLQVKNCQEHEMLALLNQSRWCSLFLPPKFHTVSFPSLTHLIKVLFLYLLAGVAKAAGFVSWSQNVQLVDHNVVSVNAILCQFLNQALSLVQWQKLGNAHTHKGCLVLEAERIGQYRHTVKQRKQKQKNYKSWLLNLDNGNSFLNTDQKWRNYNQGRTMLEHRTSEEEEITSHSYIIIMVCNTYMTE